MRKAGEKSSPLTYLGTWRKSFFINTWGGAGVFASARYGEVIAVTSENWKAE
jgi:hypothetical protein